MAILNWLLRVAVFLLLVGLAARNSDPVTVRFLFGQEWRLELSLVLFIMFFLGVLLGGFAGWSLARRRATATGLPPSTD